MLGFAFGFMILYGTLEKIPKESNNKICEGANISKSREEGYLYKMCDEGVDSCGDDSARRHISYWKSHDLIHGFLRRV